MFAIKREVGNQGLFCVIGLALIWLGAHVGRVLTAFTWIVLRTEAKSEYQSTN